MYTVLAKFHKWKFHLSTPLSLVSTTECSARCCVGLGKSYQFFNCLQFREESHFLISEKVVGKRLSYFLNDHENYDAISDNLVCWISMFFNSR